MKYIDSRWKFIASGGAGAVILFSIVLGLIAGRYRPNSEFIVPIGNATRATGTTWTLFNSPWIVPNGSSASLTDTIIGLGIIIALLPLAYISLNNYRYMNSVERNIPMFLNDLLEATDSGLVLPKALIEASKEDYGPISREIGIAITKFSMGYDFKSSIMEASKRLRHPRMPQVGIILAEAYAAGGKMHDVLSSSVRLFNSIEEYEEERQTELKPYTQLVYISVVIFLVIVLIIISQFIGPLTKLPAATSAIGSLKAGSSSINLTKIPAMFFESIFFIAAVFESVFGGIVAGKIVEGSASAGLRHSIILLAITIVVFNAPGVGIFTLA
jgi:archaeal flagellar protein FlaJ